VLLLCGLRQISSHKEPACCLLRHLHVCVEFFSTEDSIKNFHKELDTKKSLRFSTVKETIRTLYLGANTTLHYFLIIYPAVCVMPLVIFKDNISNGSNV